MIIITTRDNDDIIDNNIMSTRRKNDAGGGSRGAYQVFHYAAFARVAFIMTSRERAPLVRERTRDIPAKSVATANEARHTTVGRAARPGGHIPRPGGAFGVIRNTLARVFRRFRARARARLMKWSPTEEATGETRCVAAVMARNAMN